MGVLLALSVVLNIILIIASHRAVVKIEKYEDFCAEMTMKVSNVLQRMKLIDDRGAFESEDEVGTVFKLLKMTLDELQTFQTVEDSDGA